MKRGGKKKAPQYKCLFTAIWYYICKMTSKKNWAIFSNDLSMNSLFIQALLKGNAPKELEELQGKTGALFSTFTLEKFINEEIRHDDHTLSENENRSIQTFSSGEQRKALLQHLIDQKPDFLVLDNVFDMLDKSSVSDLIVRLKQLSTRIKIIQIVKRKSNLLPFITHVLEVEKEKVISNLKTEIYLESTKYIQTINLHSDLPEALEKIQEVPETLVQFNNVEVNYGTKTIVRDINWTINKGDFWQLKGPNGSGKTTLLSMITGDNPKAYGQDVVLFGRRRGTGESIWEIKKNIGYITPSMISQFRGWNTVEKMVISGFVDSIGLYKKPSALQRRIALQWIKLIGLEKDRHTRFSTLNEGQQCMVMIARAMVKHPPLLILDEPAHGLNDANALLLSALINKIAAEGNTIIIFVSHRNEPGLKPKQVFELHPHQKGSKGIVIQN